MDPDRVRRGQLTVLAAKCVLRETAVGTWQMTVDETAQWSPLIAEGWRVLVVEDARTLFSGPITEIGVTEEGQVRDLELAGVTDMVALEDRIVLPDPTQPSDQQTTVTNWARKGAAETLIADLVNLQAGPQSPFDARRTAGLTSLVSQGRGAPSSVNARFSLLLDEVRALATVGGLVVDVVQVDADLVPTVRVPVDRSRSVKFQLKAGLGKYELKHTGPSTTVVLVGGQGEGTARAIHFGSQATTWGRRVERFQDRRDTPDPEELAKAAAETLAEAAETAMVTFTVVEAEGLRYGQDYELGDTVTVALPGGGEVMDGVRVVEMSWGPHGRTVEPTIGPPGAEPPKASAQVTRTRQLMRQVRGLETRR